MPGPNLDLLRQVCAAPTGRSSPAAACPAWPTCAPSPACGRSASTARSSARRCTRARSRSPRRSPRWPVTAAASAGSRARPSPSGSSRAWTSTPAGWSRASTSATCATPATRSSCAAAYDRDGADELVFLDITASSDRAGHHVRRGPPHRRAGIHPADRRRRRAQRGRRGPAAAGRRRQGVAEHRRHRPARAAHRGRARFGSQCIVLSVDARTAAPAPTAGFEVTTHGGRRGTGHRRHRVGAPRPPSSAWARSC